MLYIVVFDLTNSDEEKIIKLEEDPCYKTIEEGALSDRSILPSFCKEVEEKQDQLTLQGIPSRNNRPLTTSEIREKENTMQNKPQSRRENSIKEIRPKPNLVLATRNQGIGNPSKIDWGNFTNPQTNSSWSKVSGKEKGNLSTKVNWKQSCRNQEFATKNQEIGNPSKNDWGNVTKLQTNSSWSKLSGKEKGNLSTNKVNWNPSFLHDENDTSPNHSTRGYPLPQRFDPLPRYETQDTQRKENYSSFKNRFNPNPGSFDSYMPDHVMRYVSQYRNPTQVHYRIPQSTTGRNPFTSSRAWSDNIDVSSISTQIPTSTTYRHGIQQGISCTDSAVYTAMTPSDHRTFIRYHLRWNISGDRMNLDKEQAKQKANSDARAILGFIYYQINNMWIPSYVQIATFLKNRNITEDYFTQQEHYTKLKEKIKLCIVGVLSNIPLRRDNVPGDSLSSWFKDLSEEDKKKIVADEVLLLPRKPMGIEHFPEYPKSPKHKTCETSNIDEQMSVETKEPGEIGEDGNKVLDLQWNPQCGKHSNIHVRQKEPVIKKTKPVVEHDNDGVHEIGNPKANEHNEDDNDQHKEPVIGNLNADKPKKDIAAHEKPVLTIEPITVETNKEKETNESTKEQKPHSITNTARQSQIAQTDIEKMKNNGKSSSSPTSGSSSESSFSKSGSSSASSSSSSASEQNNGTQDLSGLKKCLSIPSKNHDKCFDLANQFATLWRNEHIDRLNNPWYQTIQVQITNLYGDCEIKKIQESFPAYYQTTNNPCMHIIYNRWIERTPTLLDTEVILVDNKNANAQAHWYDQNYDSDFDQLDVNNDLDPFTPPYAYQRKDMFKFFYHIGLNSMFDIGFQQAALETNPVPTSQNFVRDLTKYNRCPMAPINEKFFKEKGLIGCMQRQKGDHNLFCTKWKFDSNQEFIRHLDEKQDCFLHYLLLKYMESIYKEEMKGLSRHIPFRNTKKKKVRIPLNPINALSKLTYLY